MNRQSEKQKRTERFIWKQKCKDDENINSSFGKNPTQNGKRALVTHIFISTGPVIPVDAAYTS